MFRKKAPLPKYTLSFCCSRYCFTQLIELTRYLPEHWHSRLTPKNGHAVTPSFERASRCCPVMRERTFTLNVVRTGRQFPALRFTPFFPSLLCGTNLIIGFKTIFTGHNEGPKKLYLHVTVQMPSSMRSFQYGNATSDEVRTVRQHAVSIGPSAATSSVLRNQSCGGYPI